MYLLCLFSCFPNADLVVASPHFSSLSHPCAQEQEEFSFLFHSVHCHLLSSPLFLRGFCFLYVWMCWSQLHMVALSCLVLLNIFSPLVFIDLAFLSWKIASVYWTLCKFSRPVLNVWYYCIPFLTLWGVWNIITRLFIQTRKLRSQRSLETYEPIHVKSET